MRTIEQLTERSERDLMPSYACLDCGRVSEQKRCPEHRVGRGAPYGKHFDANRLLLLERDPVCVYCNAAPSTTAHHDPTRRRLIAMGVKDPDGLEWLRASCASCHSKRTRTGR